MSSEQGVESAGTGARHGAVRRGAGHGNRARWCGCRRPSEDRLFRADHALVSPRRPRAVDRVRRIIANRPALRARLALAAQSTAAPQPVTAAAAATPTSLSFSDVARDATEFSDLTQIGARLTTHSLRLTATLPKIADPDWHFPGFFGDTGPLWFIDAGADGTVEKIGVFVGDNDGGLIAAIVGNTAIPNVLCAGQATVESGGRLAIQVPTACVGSPTKIAIAVETLYDVHEDVPSPSFVDTAPDVGLTGPVAVATTTPSPAGAYVLDSSSGLRRVNVGGAPRNPSAFETLRVARSARRCHDPRRRARLRPRRDRAAAHVQHRSQRLASAGLRREAMAGPEHRPRRRDPSERQRRSRRRCVRRAAFVRDRRKAGRTQVARRAEVAGGGHGAWRRSAPERARRVRAQRVRWPALVLDRCAACRARGLRGTLVRTERLGARHHDPAGRQRWVRRRQDRQAPLVLDRHPPGEACGVRGTVVAGRRRHAASRCSLGSSRGRPRR